MSEKILFSWSGGKDSSLALYEIQKSPEYEVEALITTVTRDYGRVSMHGLRKELLHAQSESLGLPLKEVFISKEASNEEYQKSFLSSLKAYKNSGISKVVFGDIFLEDIKEYRQNLLANIEMECIFPIWNKDSSTLAQQFIEDGFKAVLVCVDTEQLDAEYSGRQFDHSLLSDLPDKVDPCGENGEFHTFVYDGPIFSSSIAHSLGDVVLRDERFSYCDILPKTKNN